MTGPMRGSGLRTPFTRRRVLKTGLLAGAGLAVVPWISHTTSAGSPSLRKYVIPLSTPPVAQPTSIVDGVARYRVEMKQFKQQVHPDLPPTTLWGYDGTWPGPTIEARRNRAVRVRWINNLPDQHLLEYAYDATIHGADMGEPHVRTVVHLHGASVLPDSDGYPEAWFTRNWAQTGPYFTTKVYNYPNDQEATSLWYHDHSLGIVRLNIFSGLAGFYFIRDKIEDELNLPQDRFEVPLLIQDRMFNKDGSLQYPTDTGGTHQFWIPEFFGDVACVNGVAFPYLDVEPRKYRFRILNGSDSRFYHFTLQDQAGNHGPVFRQIGTDGGLLPRPVNQHDLLIAPAERFDVVIDFAGAEGKTFTLLNDAPAPYPGGGEIDLPEVMQFRVTKPLTHKDTSTVPHILRPEAPLNPWTVEKERYIMLSEADRDSDGYPIIGELGGSPLNATPSNPTGGARWDDPVTENPKAGSVEIWNLVNTTTDAHPIHLHLVQFEILERRHFNLAHFNATGRVRFTGPPIPPAENEQGAHKDTVKAFPGLDKDGNVVGLVTRLVARFDLPEGTVAKRGQKFRYVFHCHILEHEDNEMMRPYDVVG
jgi:spore coat protein A, manganese oxidase